MDFLFYTDQNVDIDAPNFRVTKTTLEALRERFERTLNRPVCLPKPYKLCDFKTAYGLLFEEELRGYDFWGYCDIDLMFGRIRHFLTKQVLDSYDRLYSRGSFCLYRNNEEMRRLYERPGNFFSLEEVFNSPANVISDEFPGMNRICVRNHISWYTDIDFVDANLVYPDRIELINGVKNYPVQIIYRLHGKLFHRYADNDVIREREILYAHWSRRSPAMERFAKPEEAAVLLPDKILLCRPEELTLENMRRWNPSLTPPQKKAHKRKHLAKFAKQFMASSLVDKKARIKLQLFRMLDMHLKKLPYP